MKKTILKSIGVFLLITSMGATLNSCGDDNSVDLPSTDSKTMKFTITVNNVTNNDFISFVVASSHQSTNTIWKINGAEQSNENAISLDKQDFTGTQKTYVIESIVPLRMASLGMQFIPVSDNTLTYSYKAEINGKIVKEEQNVSLASPNSLSKDYTY